MFRLQQRIALLLFLVLALALPAAAQEYLREELRVPMPEAGERGLQALFIRPGTTGRYPLVVISHGAPRDPAFRQQMSPYASLPVAMHFARRGYAVAIVMRRGYGTSGGVYSEGVDCNRDANFAASGLTAAGDIRAAFEFFARRPDVDANTMIALGESAGGLSSIALSASAPRGLVAVISFAGGRGSRGPLDVCQAGNLISAFAQYGRTSRIPTLWIYAENDKFFEPKLAREFYEAFVRAGGKAEFVRHPPHGEDGHNLFYRGISLWTPYVDSFLTKNNLPLLRTLLPPQISTLPPPPKLSASGLRSFQEFLNSGPNRAFAVAPDGAYGWRAGVGTRERAIQDALANCKKYSDNCQLYIVNDEILNRLSPAAPGYAR